MNGHLATMTSGEPYGAIRDGALAVSGGRIVYVGPESALPDEVRAGATDVLDVGGAWVTPGLIDCHTHIVFGGDRAQEFERRLGGASYEEIARAGGGILSTVRATRAAPAARLLQSAQQRLDALVRGGVTTAEVKSGYGLDVVTELEMLRVAGRLNGPRVQATLLGAHALPPECRDDREGYVDLVCSEMIPAAASEGLASAVDAFCEGIAFSLEECRRVLETGIRHGLHARLHADQLTDGGGAALAAELGARSADHLEYTSESGVRAMADAGTTAVLLPGAFYFLGETQRPPIEAFRAHGVPMAVATDSNPGSSPLTSPLLALNMACVLFGLTPEEALTGMTRHAASVLGLDDGSGTLSAGAPADLVVWDVGHPAELSYWMGGEPARLVMSGGRRIYARTE